MVGRTGDAPIGAWLRVSLSIDGSGHWRVLTPLWPVFRVLRAAYGWARKGPPSDGCVPALNRGAMWLAREGGILVMSL